MLTSQVGTRSNYIGAHLSNFESEAEIEHFHPNGLFIVESVLELGPSGWTATDSLDTGMSQHTEIFRQVEIPLHPFQTTEQTDDSQTPDFSWETTVRYWTDYWKAEQFPTHMSLLSPGAPLGEFYWTGDKIDFGESEIRRSMEEMDVILCHQMIGNLQPGGFARHTVELADFLHDELPKRPWFQLCPVETSDSSLINFARLFYAISDNATIVLDRPVWPSETAPFTQTATTACGIFALPGNRNNFQVGLFDMDFELLSQGKSVWQSPGFDALSNPAPQLSHRTGSAIMHGLHRAFHTPLPFPPQLVGQSYGEVEVRGVLTESKPAAFQETLQALRNFRLAGNLKKTGEVEMDDWAAMEEFVDAALGEYEEC